MDPQALLCDLEAALDEIADVPSEDALAAMEYRVRDYRNWRRIGGSEPPCGDHRIAVACLRLKAYRLLLEEVNERERNPGLSGSRDRERGMGSGR